MDGRQAATIADKTERQTMYVKVTHGDSMGGDFFLEVHGPLHSGMTSIDWPSADSDELPDAGQALAREIGRQMLYPTDSDHSDDGLPQLMPFNRIHVLEINEDRRMEYERNRDVLAVRYVWWDEPGDGLHAVVTTRNIFIVGDNGKTIDRV